MDGKVGNYLKVTKKVKTIIDSRQARQSIWIEENKNANKKKIVHKLNNHNQDNKTFLGECIK